MKVVYWSAFNQFRFFGLITWVPYRKAGFSYFALSSEITRFLFLATLVSLFVLSLSLSEVTINRGQLQSDFLRER